MGGILALEVNKLWGMCVKGLPSRCKCEILRYAQNDILVVKSFEPTAHKRSDPNKLPRREQRGIENLIKTYSPQAEYRIKIILGTMIVSLALRYITQYFSS